MKIPFKKPGGPRSVDSILSCVSRLVTELRENAEVNGAHATELHRQAEAAANESSRAARAAEKINELIS